MDDLEEVTKVMKALLLSFGQDKSALDSEFEKYWRRHGDLNELERRYVPGLSKMFLKKA
jgi:hypothetical protein